MPSCYVAILRVFATGFEEVSEQFCGFGFQEALFGLKGVVESGVGGQVVEGAGEPGLWVGCGVDEAGDTGGIGGAGAHGAWFEGGIEGTAGKSPASELDGGFSEGQEFGVGGRVLGGFPLIGGDGEHFTVASDEGAYGNLASLRGLSGCIESTAHHGQILLVIGEGLKVSGHGADNSSDGLA